MPAFQQWQSSGDVYSAPDWIFRNGFRVVNDSAHFAPRSEITPAGRAFAEADILRRKELFRAAALENIALIRQITRSLEARADHTLPDGVFEDLLDEHFSEEERV